MLLGVRDFYNHWFHDFLKDSVFYFFTENNRLVLSVLVSVWDVVLGISYNYVLELLRSVI